VATDSYDEPAQVAASRLQLRNATLRALSARFSAWVAGLGADALVEASTEACDHAYVVRRAEARAEHQMSGPEEDLYAELATTGSVAWNRLHSDVTSQLVAEVSLPSGPARLPMAAVRGLATDADPAVRSAAFAAELAAWPTVATPLAAAMNAIKGEAITVNRRRGWPGPLDASLFANGVDRETFEAMWSAIGNALGDLRGWMRTKASLHGHDGGLPWSDLFAPLPTAPPAVSWDEGLATVVDAFSTYGTELAGLAKRAAAEQWIDAEPREGKRGGAFCAPLTGDRSIVFMNWSGSADSVQTLAHELGHAFHNTRLAERTPMQRQLPMALAETASIFCETIVVEALLADAADAERLAMLDVDLQGTTQVLVDIRSRFLFETAVFDRRAGRTLGPSELCGLMVDAQDAAYAEGLADGSRHPWMWAVKPHYYSSHYYNWPYAFGLLFGLGLHARFVADPDHFRAGYDSLLADTGVAGAVELGRRFGFDVRDEAFWEASLDVVRARIAAYRLLAGHAG
jgi:oligoendopeptidase F